MTHAPPVPEAQRAPWPAHPAPIDPAPEAPAAALTSTVAAAEPAAGPTPAPAAPSASAAVKPAASTRTMIGVGAAIGSAAVAAALLYVNHGRKDAPARKG